MSATRGYEHASGFTLVELMVSMVLGLIVIGGALGAMLANRQSYRTNEGLSQIQENARIAFELLARDIRQAGVTGCDSSGRIANTLNPGTRWWQNWFGLLGYEGTQPDTAVGFGTSSPNNRVPGTDSIQVQGVEGIGFAVVAHEPTAANIEIDATTAAVVDGDILMICDFDHAAIFQVTNAANVTVEHGTGTGEPGNCTMGLGYPARCTNPGNSYAYGANSQIAHLSAADWYIGNNGRLNEGGRSLFRRRMNLTEEVIAGVTNMQIGYREAGRNDFREATLVDTWVDVNAVRITLTIRSADQRISTDTNLNSGRLEREFTSVITLRNRVP